MAMLLTGCSAPSRLENQAHAVTMGIDILDEKIMITIQVPSFGGKSDGGEKKGASEYQIYKASGKDFPTAFNILSATVPQELNLSHLKTIVISRAFAENEQFKDHLNIIMSMYSLSQNAIAVISEGQASQIVENQKPHIGIRLSQILPAMLDYRQEAGVIPLCTLSQLYAGMNSAYSTSVCALSAAASAENEKNNESYLPGEMEREGENKNEYMGCALFDREKMVGILNGRETQLLRLLRGEKLRNLRFTEPYAMYVTNEKNGEVVFFSDNGKTEIRIDVYLSAVPLNKNTDTGSISEIFEDEFRRVIEKCISYGTEPFGFAEIASGKFHTVDKWIAYDWLSTLKKADIHVKVHMEFQK